MKLNVERIVEQNQKWLDSHKAAYGFLAEKLEKNGTDVQIVLKKLEELQVAIPSWALGAGGTRFGRFSYHGEPASLKDKISDVGLLHALTQTAGAISLHIPWDIPEDAHEIQEFAASLGIGFDAVNSNTFQDQPKMKKSYRFGSLCNPDPSVRDLAIQHNLDVIDIGKKLGSKSLTTWLADGSNFPGQHNFQEALKNTENSLQLIYRSMPDDWKLFIEYKPYEPNFYSTVIQDWGTSLMLANACGNRAYTLVDLGHHLPNTNIEQIVATLMMKGKLGGFHFNDSKYGDDDLTVGSIKPYALFLIWNELIYGMEHNTDNPSLAWMIDASHNIKDPLEDLLQSLEAIQIAHAQALLVDQKVLRETQNQQDVVLCQEVLQDAYRTDVRPLLREARLRSNAAIEPIAAYRAFNVRNELVKERGSHSVASGL
ncbi:sugar isomerase [uncultured Croceitalea sp.]|uniref:sugar isomerase n=1 Tax=uncultured Croceitalea sp. TaxID=1798908 RepID=UPI00330597CC